jgi:hypothetical protein
MNLDQQVRWQHLVIFAALVGLLSGGIMFAIGVAGAGSDRAAPWWVGALVFLGAAALGVFAVFSLRGSTAKRATYDLLTRGLYRLPADAPRPLVELNADLAAHFGLPATYLKPAMPTTFGSLVAVTSQLAQSGAAVAPGQHEAARAALARALGRPPESVSWGTPIVDVFPAGRQRFLRWEQLRTAAPLLPPVVLNPVVENIAIYGFLAGLIAIAVPIAQKLDAKGPPPIPDNAGTRIVGKVFGLVLFAGIISVLMVPVYFIGRRYAARLPAEVRSMGDLARFFQPAVVAPQAWTPDVVAPHVRDLVSRRLNVPPGSLSDQTPIASPSGTSAPRRVA